MAANEDAGPPMLQPCPSCGRTDRVAGVPAVYHAGRDSVRITTPARFDDPAQTVTRSVTTSLSSALAPAPADRPSQLGALAAVFLTILSVGTFAGGAAAGHWFSEDSTPTPSRDRPFGNYPFDTNPFDPAPVTDAPQSVFSFLGWISALALLTAIVLFVRAARRGSARRRLLAGRATAERLWSQGWYCGRCATVHFRAASGTVPTALTLQEFRAVVWEAGGYGHLAHVVSGDVRQDGYGPA
ncbi:hypothetical protein [Kitasatospora sp. NPDC057223]|uniref:hypothetical protein n=1 Tax=Kitasatospora sp. NPDC057223 TaxID=3346055 RepID=UPI00363D7185